MEVKVMKNMIFYILGHSKHRIVSVVLCCVLIASFVIGNLSACHFSNAASTSSMDLSSKKSTVVSSTTSSVSSALSLPSQESTDKTSSDAHVIVTEQQAVDKIQKTVSLDWNKYRLKNKGSVTIAKVAYWKFELWDDCYYQSPFILINPQTGSIYTWMQSDAAPVPASEDKAFDKTPQIFIAFIYDFSMNSISLKTSDGDEFTVPNNIDTSGIHGAVCGDKVKITYTGIRKGNDMSRVFFVKIEKIKA
jgi:hypothetical protein